jgi:hypothetical protein
VITIATNGAALVESNLPPAQTAGVLAAALVQTQITASVEAVAQAANGELEERARAAAFKRRIDDG